MQDPTKNSGISTNKPRHSFRVLFNLPVAEGIETSPGPQTGSTRGNSSPRGSPRGHGCNGCRSGCGDRQDPIDDAFADIVRPANRDWACQTERCHTLSNKTSLQ